MNEPIRQSITISIEPQQIVDMFHVQYYGNCNYPCGMWRGREIHKCPMDLMVYQEIIWETQPDIIIETGTHCGGSALFLADLCQLIGHGEVVTVDICDTPEPLIHPRIDIVLGSSVDVQVCAWIRQKCMGKRTMVILDSDHTTAYVRNELEKYAPLVSVGCYLVVEDTNIHGHPVAPTSYSGPMEALQEWSLLHPEFQVDRAREKYLMTFNPNGYWRRTEHGHKVE